MTKRFYEWEDTSDPHATGVPDFGKYPQYRLLTKTAVRKDVREYLKMFPDIAARKPKIRVWRISYTVEKVKI
jgi:hypothetical protein